MGSEMCIRDSTATCSPDGEFNCNSTILGLGLYSSTVKEAASNIQSTAEDLIKAKKGFAAAKLAISTASAVVGIIGIGLAFFTFGTSIAVATAVGAGLGVASLALDEIDKHGVTKPALRELKEQSQTVETCTADLAKLHQAHEIATQKLLNFTNSDCYIKTITQSKLQKTSGLIKDFKEAFKIFKEQSTNEDILEVLETDPKNCLFDGNLTTLIRTFAKPIVKKDKNGTLLEIIKEARCHVSNGVLGTDISLAIGIVDDVIEHLEEKREKKKKRETIKKMKESIKALLEVRSVRQFKNLDNVLRALYGVGAVDEISKAIFSGKK